MIISQAPALGFSSEPTPTSDCGTWTLTTVLGKWLAELEERYGRRDMSYTPLGIEFFGDVPLVWYPGDRRHVAIRLTQRARTELPEALFELAHETVHLLAPTGNNRAPVIEEGLAVLFSHVKSAEEGLGLNASRSRYYMFCEAKLKDLLSFSPDAISDLRKLEPSFYAMTPEMIQSLDSRISGDLAQTLCRPGPDVRGQFT